MPPSSNGLSAWVDASDEDVLRGIARRDERALGAFYDRYGARAFALAYRLLADRGAAEDVVQDAFMSVWRRAISFEPGRGSAQRWLLAIVHHRAIDRLRGAAGRVRHEAPLDLLDRVLATDDPWHEIDLGLRRDQLRRWLAELPESQRRTLELAYFEGYTQHEIAALLGVPLGTVKARARLGLRKLRDLTVGIEARDLGVEPARGHQLLDRPAGQTP